MTKFQLGILTCCLFAVNTLAAERKPNVIVIMADDIGFECYGSYGSKHYSTPNIDQLASTGAKFTHAYAQPLCTPSRVKLMTGRYNFRNYIKFNVMDLHEPTFATMLKSAGYRTFVGGKWQLSPSDLKGPNKTGFDEYCLWHFMALGRKTKDPLFKARGPRFRSPNLFLDGKVIPNTEGKYGPDIVTDKICDFIDKNKEQPFLVYYPMILVHNPFVPTPKSDDWGQDKQNKKYFPDMVKAMDDCIGRIVKKVDDSGLREDTLIIVTGDNGTNKAITSPLPGRGNIKGGKGMMTDAGTRVAFIANWKGQIKPKTVIDSPIDLADVLPTIAEVTKTKAPKNIDGQSLWPMLQGDDSKARGWVFISYSRSGTPFRCFVRDERWKLYGNGKLYDVPNDWLEKTPATGAEADKARQRLQPILEKIMKQAPAKRFVRR